MDKLEPRVAVLMSTYNGARFLPQQLDSIVAQNHENWTVYVSDDGSQDTTLDILRDYQKKWGEDKLHVLRGPREGFAANFMSILANETIQANFFAFSDQDDIWKPEKLTTALEFLLNIPNTEPGLYCSRTELIDEKNLKIGLSPFFVRSPSFRNALVQSIAGGNTMVFNTAAVNIGRVLMAQKPSVVSHDWTMYQLVTGAGGYVKYDDWASVQYRQHGANIIGSNLGVFARMVRISQLLAGKFKEWNSVNINALEALNGELTDDAQNLLLEFKRLRENNPFLNPRIVSQNDFYRHTRMGNLALNIGLLLKRV